jgi:hypothetical protein
MLEKNNSGIHKPVGISNPFTPGFIPGVWLTLFRRIDELYELHDRNGWPPYLFLLYWTVT